MLLEKRGRCNIVKNSEYENTPIGRIPKDWKVLKIEDLFRVETGTTPSTKNKGYWNGSINWITPADMSKLKTQFIKKSGRTITKKALKDVNLTLMPRGSLIISTWAPVGYVAIVGEETTFNQGCKGLIPKDDTKVNSEFYCYYLLSKNKILQNLSGGSTFKELSKSMLEKFSVPFLSFSEQKAITSVLSAVDNAIQKVDEAIAKIERLKKGLMQKLLTKGIGHTRFKKTEIGEIPEEWEVVRLNHVAKIKGNKNVHEFEKVPFIPMELVSESEIYTEYEMREKGKVKSCTFCQAGDLLLAKITPSLENGKQGIVPDNIPGNFALATTEVFPIKCEKIDKFFLFYILKFSKFRNRIISSMIGTTGRQRASKNFIRKLSIPLPPLTEQKKIAEILSTVDERLGLERKRKTKLERIKKGLMNDLLTGRKRVKVLHNGE